MRYLLDSNIIIDYLNEVRQARHWIEGHQPLDLAVSVVTCAESFAGLPPDEWFKLEILFDRFNKLDITFRDGLTAARLRQVYRFKLPDALQAAVAIDNELALVTRNTKDFNPTLHKFIHVPYVLKP